MNLLPEVKFTPMGEDLSKTSVHHSVLPIFPFHFVYHLQVIMLHQVIKKVFCRHLTVCRYIHMYLQRRSEVVDSLFEVRHFDVRHIVPRFQMPPVVGPSDVNADRAQIVRWQPLLRQMLGHKHREPTSRVIRDLFETFQPQKFSKK
jgi:hypothetical protein